jgi:hypothetical protein
MDPQQGPAVAPRAAGEIEREPLFRAGFTRRERRRLAFLRWLYRAGRLTEWG